MYMLRRWKFDDIEDKSSSTEKRNSYGDYEGHTGYRADPIAIACIFGLKSLEELDIVFDGNLDKVLTMHFCHE